MPKVTYLTARLYRCEGGGHFFFFLVPVSVSASTTKCSHLSVLPHLSKGHLHTFFSLFAACTNPTITCNSSIFFTNAQTKSCVSRATICITTSKSQTLFIRILVSLVNNILVALTLSVCLVCVPLCFPRIINWQFFSFIKLESDQ